jgi:excisionase family DNA binding protein
MGVNKEKPKVAVGQLAQTVAAHHQHDQHDGPGADDPLLTTEQAADLRNCCVTTVQRHARRGLIPFYRSGPHGEYRFRKSSLLGLEIPARKAPATGRKRRS